MKLATTQLGSGPRRTALIHGFLGSGRNLSTLGRRVVAGDPTRTVFLPDLAGHGLSPPLPPGADLATFAGDLLETLGDGPLDLVGHSLGGRVALAAARLAPERVRSLMLLDIAPGPVHHWFSESAKVLQAVLKAPATAKDRETMRRVLLDEGLTPALTDWVLMNLRSGGEGYEWRIDARALQEAAPRVNNADLWDVVEARRVPMSCLRGELAPYVTDADVCRFEAAGCPVTTLAGSGHYVHVDALEAVAAAILAR
jgi:esterase